MKTAIVIPTCNAVRRGVWEKVLQSVENQKNCDICRIVLDSSSEDSTCLLAAEYGWKIIRLHRENFNHGKTRDRICRILYKRGFESLVFLSQDAILETPDSLAGILDFLHSNHLSGCYGRQKSSRDTLNSWQQKMFYPENSHIKSYADFTREGLMAVFFSNAFSAWNLKEVIKYGGFPKTDFGEDTLLAFQVITRGGKLGYCSESSVVHEHSNSLRSLFVRGLQIGLFHKEHSAFFRLFKKSSLPLEKKLPPLRFFLPFLTKCIGYFSGRFGEKLLPLLLFLLVWIQLVPAIFLSEVPQRDVAGRYIPMAEAFAAGNWDFAFHPRIPPFFTCCAGILLSLLRCNPFTACKLASALFLSLAVFPLYAGCRKIYDKKIAFLSCFLLVFSPYLLRLGYYALRETCGIFALSLLFYGAVLLAKCKKNFGGLLAFASGGTILLSSRGDAALFVGLAYLAFFVWDFRKNLVPWRFAVILFLSVSLLFPLLRYNYRMVGYAVPEFRHAILLNKVTGKIPALDFLRNPAPEMPLKDTAPGGKKR